MPRALIALGTNLGDRAALLAEAIERLRDLATGEFKVSRPHETAPAGGPAGQEPFLNAAAVCETTLAPADLLARLRAIEDDLGRVRTERWGARLIDLDLLLYDNAPGQPALIATADLQVPHPRMAFRRFVLQPAADVAAEMLHPVIALTVEQLLDRLNHSPPLLAILGGTAAERNALAQAAAEQSGAACILDPSADKPTRHEDSSGRTPAAPLQFLRDTAQLLSQHDWQSDAWVVSAVSLQQVMADALAAVFAGGPRFDPAALPDLDVLAKSLGPAAWPRLLVLLDDWSELVALRRGDRPQSAQSVRQTSLLVASSAETAVLCVGRNDRAAQLAEISAAMVAMR